MLITTYAFWMLLGIALLLGELFVPGLIIAFFGIGALTVGVLTMVGLIETLPVQLTVFAGVSLISLFGLRRHFHRWLRGSEADAAERDLDNAGFVGARVEVLADFADGAGPVKLNGTKWDAESTDELKAGQHAWVLEHKGIILRVSGTRPQ